MSLVIVIVISYLLGSFPTAYLFVKKFTPLEKPPPTASIWSKIWNFLTGFTGQDIRKIGSGNVGAMNVFRALKDKSKAEPPTSEAKWEARREMKTKSSATRLAIIGFLVTLIIDMAKGALAIFLAQKFLPLNSFALPLAAFFVVLGHNYSIFLKFTGGRGAACLIGILLYLDFLALIVWGLPIIFFSILFQIILEKTGFERKINWKKISDIVALIGTQMAGRMAGLIFGLVPLYFYNPQIFLPIAAGTILLLIKNISRFKGYFLGEKIAE